MLVASDIQRALCFGALDCELTTGRFTQLTLNVAHIISNRCSCAMFVPHISYRSTRNLMQRSKLSLSRLSLSVKLARHDVQSRTSQPTHAVRFDRSSIAGSASSDPSKERSNRSSHPPNLSRPVYFTSELPLWQEASSPDTVRSRCDCSRLRSRWSSV